MYKQFRNNSQRPVPSYLSKWSRLVKLQEKMVILGYDSHYQFLKRVVRICLPHVGVLNWKGKENFEEVEIFDSNRREQKFRASTVLYYWLIEVYIDYGFSGDGRAKMPLSPTIAGDAQRRPFGLRHSLNSSSDIQLMESSLYPSTSSMSHSYSSNNLGQMQLDSISMGSFWSPHRSQMRLQSRRSQSREDLNSSLAEAHMVKI